LNLGKPLETFVVLTYFNHLCLICSLQAAESPNFANKPDLEWGFNNFDYNCIGYRPIHSKKCWVVLTQFWVKYGQTQTLG